MNQDPADILDQLDPEERAKLPDDDRMSILVASAVWHHGRGTLTSDRAAMLARWSLDPIAFAAKLSELRISAI